MSSENLIMYWSGSSLGTLQSNPGRPTFNTLLKLKDRNPDWKIHIITHSDCLPDDEALILAEQTATLTEAGIIVLDAAKPFSELGFNTDLERFYRRAISEGKGVLAHVFGSDICRIAMLERFKEKNILYMDVDINVSTPLSSLTNIHPTGVLIDGEFTWAGGIQLGNGIFYIDSGFLGQLFSSLISSYLLANLKTYDLALGDTLFKPTEGVFDYVFSLTGPSLWSDAINRFAGALEHKSKKIFGHRISRNGILRDVLRLQNISSETKSTWIPEKERSTERYTTKIPQKTISAIDRTTDEAMAVHADHRLEMRKKEEARRTTTKGPGSRFELMFNSNKAKQTARERPYMPPRLLPSWNKPIFPSMIPPGAGAGGGPIYYTPSTPFFVLMLYQLIANEANTDNKDPIPPLHDKEQ